MSGGPDLLGAPAGEPRKRGRPKGSTNRRAKDLKGFIEARFGASAAQQSADLCMVTPRELKAAGGSIGRAQVAKAIDLVRHVREAKGRLDGELQQLVREAVEDVALQLVELKGKELRQVVATFVHQVQHLGGEFGLPQAMKLLADERAALLPYTDQRQPLAVEAVGDGFRPAVVVMGGMDAPAQLGSPTEIAGEFRVLGAQVAQSKSHEDSQALELPGLLPPRATD